MARDPGTVVLADVGGTNVRFALLKGGVLGEVQSNPVREHKTFDDALAAFMDRQPDRAAIRGALFAIAGVVKGERCELTNNAWVIDAAELRAAVSASPRFVSSTTSKRSPGRCRTSTAIICSRSAAASPAANAPMLVFGPGTGLGVAAYVPDTHGGLVLRSEGGHATLPSASPREDAIIAHLRQSFGHVSAERVLSGRRIGKSLSRHRSHRPCERAGAQRGRDHPSGHRRPLPDLPRRASTRSARCSARSPAIYRSRFARRAACSSPAASSGISATICRSTQFRARFEAKGRFQAYLAAIPVYVIPRGEPAFVGLQALAAATEGH